METLELTEKACRVYVGNLLPKVKEVHLTSKLARFGTIHSVWIARRPPGFAFVRFSTPKEAQRAVEASKNGTMEVLGKTVRVQIAGHKPQQSENNVEREPCARQSEPVESVHCHHGERWRRVSRSRSRDIADMNLVVYEAGRESEMAVESDRCQGQDRDDMIVVAALERDKHIVAFIAVEVEPEAWEAHEVPAAVDVDASKMKAVCLTNLKSPPKDVARVFQECAAIITSHGGVIRSTENRGEKRLGYGIEDRRWGALERHYESKLIVQQFNTSPAVLEEVEAKLKNTFEIIRFQTFKIRDPVDKIMNTRITLEDAMLLLNPAAKAKAEQAAREAKEARRPRRPHEKSIQPEDLFDTSDEQEAALFKQYVPEWKRDALFEPDTRESHTLRACVWSTQSFPLPPADDELTLVAMWDTSLFRRLRVFHDSFVTLCFQERRHVAKLRFISNQSIETSSRTKDHARDVHVDVILSPLLAFNLGIPLTNDAIISLSITCASPQELGLCMEPAQPYPRHCQEQPATAISAMIAPLVVSSLSCQHHVVMQQRDGLVEALRAYFSSAKVLQRGDIFAIELRETTQSHVPKENERYRKEYEPYKCMQVLAVCIVSGTEESTESVTELMPPTLDLDTALMFFRVEKLVGKHPDALALTISQDTELMQGSSISASAPDEAILKQFLLEKRDGIPAPLFTSRPPSSTQQKLYEILYPAQVCKIPVSLLLSGASGVGKRTLVHQVAKQLGVVTVEIPFTELTGQSELQLLENVRDQVSKAQALSPCLLYISHLFPVEKDNEEAELRLGAVLSECIRSLSEHQHNIPLIASVEDVSEISKFIRQCFLYEMHLEAPDQLERLEFLKHMAESIELNDDVDLAEIAQITAGRTYGELSSVLADAGSLAIERMLGEEREVSFESLTESLPVVEDKYRTSLTERMLIQDERDLDFDVIVYENDTTIVVKRVPTNKMCRLQG
ncbi:hypothetical protein PsorP6_015688 [Peronosclerospora sorghi]|uniref:Uncharacterized protein n=1 Tax=Peronosclerospora sorghi TaxID=230839 RepID=A0ACC0WM20_9STRA|nr:hypothetical protein PsorP6_015688 [Peronosclerospora sorghi]